MKQTEVNNMNELTLDKFNERMEPIEAFMNTNDIGSKGTIVTLQAEQGRLETETDEGRGNLWDSIRAMVKNIEGLQLRQGRRSSLPAEIMVNVNSVKQTVYTACATLIDSCAVILETFLPHGKTGGNYTKETFCDYIADKVESNLISAYRDKNGKRWDGTLNKDGMTGMVAPVKAEAETNDSTDTEVSEEE